MCASAIKATRRWKAQKPACTAWQPRCRRPTSLALSRRRRVLGRAGRVPTVPCVPMAYGLWCAVRRYSSATRLCGASGTRYMTTRGLICSRRVPSG
eukprot:2098107-Prymnesium_polylepis.1